MVCVNSVGVSPKFIILEIGNYFYDTNAKIQPSDVHCNDVIWRSEDPSIASVHPHSGYIYAESVGTTRIYAIATDGSDCRDSIIVTVRKTVPVISITLDRYSLYLKERQTADISAIVYPNNASNKKLNWTSSNNDVVMVSNGFVAAVSKGFATITATASDGSGISVCCSVNVTGNI